MLSQKKDVILIVGGGSGIDKAIAERLIKLKEILSLPILILINGTQA